MSGDVRLVSLQPSPTAVVVATTSWADFPSQWKPMLDKVWGFLRTAPPGLYKDGHNIMLYKDNLPNVEVGVQVNRAFEATGDVRPSSLPGGTVATATHAGQMDKIGETHKAVRTWCADHGHRLTGVWWEIYGDPDPATGRFVVEVFWSVR
jgi:effector-binding domain-containing protein